MNGTNLIRFSRRAVGSARAWLGRADDRLRTYEAASSSPRLQGWPTGGSGSPQSEVEAAGPTLRARSRHLAQNNPYARRAVYAVCANAVGAGIVASVKNKGRAKTWDTWANSLTPDFLGKHTFYGLQSLVMRTMVESGEVFVRRIVEKGKLRLQVLEPEYLEKIETDAYSRPLAYHLYKTHPTEGFTPSVRIPADDVIHLFHDDRAGQGRGVPWLAPIVLELRDLSDYQDAELMRRKIASCMAAFITFPRGWSAADKQSFALTKRLSPGTITEIPDGGTLQVATPPQVSGDAEFVSTHLRAAAAGMGITYEILTGDYSQVNFSSGRMGWIEMQRMIDSWRWHLLIPHFCDRVWGWFCDIQFDTPVEVKWTPPRREMLDPVKEITGQQLAVESGFTSISEVIRQNGEDPEQVFSELTSDIQRLKSVFVALGKGPKLKNDSPTASA